MKKRIWFFALVLVLVLPIAFAFAGCKSNNSDGEKKPVEETQDVGGEQNNSGEQEQTKEWNVTIHSFGDATFQVEDGALLPQQRDPWILGHRFGGWFADEDCTEEFDFTKPITKDTEIWAKFIPQCTVTFETNGGSEIADVDVDEGTAVAKPQDPTKTGFKFDAWYTDDELSAMYDFSSAITEDITLYANWYDENLTVEIDGEETKVSSCDFSATSITIPTIYKGHKVTSIAEFAFNYSPLLTSITIPDSVTSIGRGFVARCNNLTIIEVSSNNAVYHSQNNCLIKTATGELVAGCKTSEIPSDGSVTRIGNWAFEGCFDLTSITIPNTITSIGEKAFCNNTGLTSIVIPDSVTSIEYGAFEYCRSLTSINIPVSVTNIGTWAFEGCTGLTSVTIARGVVGQCAFYGCTSLVSVTIQSGATSFGQAVFHDCNNLTSIFYTGTAEQWTHVTIDINNTELTSATLYYYSETAPTIEGNYWHYDEDGKTPLVWPEIVPLEETYTQVISALKNDDGYGEKFSVKSSSMPVGFNIDTTAKTFLAKYRNMINGCVLQNETYYKLVTQNNINSKIIINEDEFYKSIYSIDSFRGFYINFVNNNNLETQSDLESFIEFALRHLGDEENFNLAVFDNVRCQVSTAFDENLCLNAKLFGEYNDTEYEISAIEISFANDLIKKIVLTRPKSFTGEAVIQSNRTIEYSSEYEEIQVDLDDYDELVGDIQALSGTTNPTLKIRVYQEEKHTLSVAEIKKMFNNLFNNYYSEDYKYYSDAECLNEITDTISIDIDEDIFVYCEE